MTCCYFDLGKIEGYTALSKKLLFLPYLDKVDVLQIRYILLPDLESTVRFEPPDLIIHYRIC